ncbi:MAG: hypothetical protein AAF590_06380 [Pseudomonadota bacterium]
MPEASEAAPVVVAKTSDASTVDASTAPNKEESQDDIDAMFASADEDSKEESQDDIDAMFASAEEDSKEESQDDIDAMFASADEDSKEESQDDIDAMFASAEEDSKEESQDDIDAMFASAGEDSKEESQDDIDDMFASASGADNDTKPAAAIAPVAQNAKRNEKQAAQADSTDMGAWSAAVSDVAGKSDARLDDAIDADMADGKGPKKVRLKSSHYLPSAFEIYATRALKVVKPATVLLGLVAVGSAVPMRDQVVRMFPDLAYLYETVGLDINVRGITFSDFTAERFEVSGLPVLRVGGMLINVDDQDVPVGPLRMALVADDGAELFVWRLDTDVRGLAPGQSLPVASELTAPPSNVAGVSVRFLQNGERIPGG